MALDKAKAIATLDMIRRDCVDDTTRYEGQPFTGQVMAEYQGAQNAMIATLATIVRELIKETE